MNADELKKRTKSFDLRIIKFVNVAPNSPAVRLLNLR